MPSGAHLQRPDCVNGVSKAVTPQGRGQGDQWAPGLHRGKLADNWATWGPQLEKAGSHSGRSAVTVSSESPSRNSEPEWAHLAWWAPLSCPALPSPCLGMSKGSPGASAAFVFNRFKTISHREAETAPMAPSCNSVLVPSPWPRRLGTPGREQAGPRKRPPSPWGPHGSPKSEEPAACSWAGPAAHACHPLCGLRAPILLF